MTLATDLHEGVQLEKYASNFGQRDPMAIFLAKILNVY